MVRNHGVPLATVFRIALSVMRFLIPLGLLLLVTAISCAAPEASQVLLPQAEPEELPPEAGGPSLLQPEPPLLPTDEEVFSALDTEVLLDIGYNEPGRIVTVEGTVVRTFYATESKGKPTFLDFHDPYQGWFMCLIWEEDRESGEPIREKFVAAFPPSPESYFLDKRVRVIFPHTDSLNSRHCIPELERQGMNLLLASISWLLASFRPSWQL